MQSSWDDANLVSCTATTGSTTQNRSSASSSWMTAKFCWASSSCSFRFRCSGRFTINKARGGFRKERRWTATLDSTQSNPINSRRLIRFSFSSSFRFSNSLFIRCFDSLASIGRCRKCSSVEFSLAVPFLLQWRWSWKLRIHRWIRLVCCGNFRRLSSWRLLR